MSSIRCISDVQEGTARLTIVSGLSLGQCLRHKYRATPALADTAVICWLVAASIFLGNLLFECNNFAGGVDAVMAMPGARALPPTGLLGIPMEYREQASRISSHPVDQK